MSLLRAIWTGKLAILIVWVVVTALGAVAVMRMTPVYRAETLILVESQKIPDKYVASTVVGDVQDRLATISQEILSTTRLRKIVDDYKLYAEERASRTFEEIIDMMRKDVDVTLEKGWSNNRPGAFRISYEGRSPMLVAAVVNRLAGLYIDENLRVREVQAEGTSQFLDAQLKDAKKTLDDLEASVSRYKLDHNGELPQQENTINTSIMRLQTQLQGVHDAINRAQQSKLMYDTELTSIESRLTSLLAARDSSATAEPERLRSVPDRPETVKKSALIAEQLRLLRTRYSDQHPEVKRFSAALAEAKKAEAQQADSTPPQAPAAAAPASAPAGAPADFHRDIDQLRQRAATLRAQRAIADDDIERGAAERDRIVREMGLYHVQLKRLPIREQEMAALTRDYEMAKANYRSLLDKKTSADMATEMERRQKAERFMVLDPAQVPERPFKPKRRLLIAVSSLAGLLCGVALSIGKALKKNVLFGEWELPPNVVILGRIPKIEIPETGESSRRNLNRKKRPANVPAAVGTLLVVVFSLAGRLSAGVL